MADLVKVYSEPEKQLAEFLVSVAGLMGPSPDGSRRSSGHQWHRRHTEDEKFFLELAEELLVEATHKAYEFYHPRED